MAEEKNINIEDIMKEIRAEIKEKGYDSSMLSFDDVKCNTSLNDGSGISSEDFSRDLQFVKLNCCVQPYKELEGPKPVVVFRKILRKLIKFYIEPVVNDQNAVNLRYVRMIDYLNGLVKPDRDVPDMRELAVQIEDLELKIKNVSLYSEALEKRIALLEKENEELKKSCGNGE